MRSLAYNTAMIRQRSYPPAELPECRQECRQECRESIGVPCAYIARTNFKIVTDGYPHQAVTPYTPLHPPTSLTTPYTPNW